jgi:hypothetical protein
MRRSGWGPPEKDPHPRAPRRRPTSALWHNLCDDTLAEVTRHRNDLRPPTATGPEPADPGPAGPPGAAVLTGHPDAAETPGAEEPAGSDGPVRASVPAEAWVEPPAVRHARERFTEVQALKAQGLSQVEIARRTGLARPTVHLATDQAGDLRIQA